MKKARAFVVLALIACLALAEPVIAQKAGAEKMKPALLVIDVQNAFLPSMSEQDKKTAFDYINGAIRRFHDRGFPVIRVYHTDPAGGPKPGSKDFEYPPTILVRSDDPQIIKTYGNAFNKTGLEKLLREKGCNVLFLCGLSASGCVLATYQGAQNLDFDVFLIREALISPDPTTTRFIAGLCETLSYEALKMILKYTQN
jgi:nicotinamidase-related amidase